MKFIKANFPEEATAGVKCGNIIIEQFPHVTIYQDVNS